jgi:hypothetical protein
VCYPLVKEVTSMLVSNEEFVVIWQQSRSLAEVVKKTGHTVGAASSRASRLRQSGVRLKYFKGPRAQPLDYEGLNDLAAEALEGE